MVRSLSFSRGLRGFFRFVLFLLSLVLFVALGFNATSSSALSTAVNGESIQISQSRIVFAIPTAHQYPHYSFNWFYNVKAPEPTPIVNNSGDSEAENTPVTTATVYTGTPTFKVCQVSQNSSITIATSKLPPSQTFTVRMGAFGTAGIGGVVAGTFESGSGEALNVSMNIPASLQGYGRMAIRIQTAHANPYHAYNWFYNSTASVC